MEIGAEGIDRLYEAFCAHDLAFLQIRTPAERLCFSRSAAPAPTDPEETGEIRVLHAPRLGTFHAAARPGANLNAGETIGDLDVLGQRFAVTAPCAGRLLRLKAQDGDLVGYGAEIAEIRQEARS